MRLLPRSTKEQIRRAIRRYTLPKTPFVKVTTHGSQMIVDLRDNATRRAYAVQREREPETIDFVKTNVKKGQICLDVGANVGVYTLLFSRLVGPEGHVYAFEPNPRALMNLRANIRLNGYDNITVVPAAVGDKSTPQRFYINRYCGWSGLTPQEGTIEAITVDGITLDSMFGNDRVDWVKIDVEGTEADVIRGMKGLLKRLADLKLIVECRSSREAVELLKELEGWDLRSYDTNLLFWKAR